MSLHTEPWIASVLESESMRESSVNANGLRFYTPDLVNGEAETAYERLEGSGKPSCLSIAEDEMEGLYMLTPDGVHAIADVDTTALEQVERDIKRVRAKRKPNCHHTNSDGNRE